MPIMPITNFTTGIRASTGYTQLKNISASDMINWDVDEYGRLTPRRGCKHINSTELVNHPLSMVRTYNGNIEQLIISLADTDGGIYYLSDALTYAKSGDVGNAPIAFAEFESKLYCSNYAATGGVYEIYVFDGTSWTKSGEVGTGPIGMAVYEGKLYVACYGSDDVYVFDGTSWTKSGDVGSEPQYLEVFEGNLYCTCSDSDEVYYFDGTTWADSGSMAGTKPVGIKTYKGKLYVACEDSADVYVYDGSSWTKSGDTASDVQLLEVYSDSLYATCKAVGEVYVFDNTSWTKSGDVGQSPIGMAVVGDNLYVACYGGDEIYYFDGTTWAKEGDVGTGTGPYDIINFEGNLVISCYDIDDVYVGTRQTFTELTNTSDNPAASILTETMFKGKFGAALMGGRLFLGTSNEQLWINISARTPVMYDHGVNDAPPDEPVVAVATDLTGVVQQSSLIGTSVTNIRDQEDDVRGVVVNETESKLYFHEGVGGDIHKCDLDGANIETVKTGQTAGWHIAMDELNSKIYWITSSGERIRYGNLDDAAVVQLYYSSGVDIRGLCVDTRSGKEKVYWSEYETLPTGKIRKCELDGSAVTDVKINMQDVTGLSIDTTNDKLFYLDGQIRSCDFDGNNAAVVVTINNNNVSSLCIDNTNGKIYWLDAADGVKKIFRADLDGTSIEEIVTENLLLPNLTGDLHSGALTIDETNSKLYWSDTNANLVNNEYHSVVTTFIRNDEAIETRPSERAVFQVDTDLGMKVTPDSSADIQVDKVAIYITEGQASAADAMTATLYYFDTIAEGDSRVFGNENNLGDEIDIDDNDNPPSWRYIENHDGRLWVADRNGTALQFSKIDSIGSPISDAFPDSNVGTDLVPYKLRPGEEDGDVITQIKQSPLGRDLIVFKTKSIIIIQGNDPSSMDASTVLQTSGAAASFSVAEVGHTLFYLASDKKIWVYDSRGTRPISLDVNPLLKNIPVRRFEQIQGCTYDNKYMLCYPTGDDDNDRILVFDTIQKYWTTYDLPMNDLSWWNGNETIQSNRDRLVGARSDSGYIDYFFKDKMGVDLTQDESTDITYVWQSNWFESRSKETNMRREFLITGVYIHPVGPTEASFTIRVDTDEVEGEEVTFTPAKWNAFRQGCFARGYLHRIRIEVTDSQDKVPDIEAFGIEFDYR